MGSGAGIAVAGMFRVATDKTVSDWCYRGSNKFPSDAGASFYLSCLPGYLREYLALTGDKLNGVEMIACGLASHYALHERLDLVEERLGKLITDEATVIETSLARYGDLVYPDKTSILYKFETFDKCFSHDTVEEIVDALENEKASTYDEWCERAISKKKRSRSTVLKSYITTVGPFIIRKVSKDMVDSYFSQLMELEPDLELPTTLQGMLDANDWGHLQTGMVRVLEDTGDLLPFIFALLVCSIIAAGAGI
ncbi:3-hydroxyisobutyryl-CoA hydrolase-like protein 2 [Populus alba x Populus x berolinensis]|uniref:3-hydroxyisobutyryl-CoA hydrolase n=2 Tax=Populus TaxID=3689 RepID=A0A4U5QNF5_POPAL|nr:3-hydroxyisobutyryl-CoA hydrolase-like protein 2 [Populus alba x Populus x berolinensis]TKS11819.1 3-hydroxyisobutyryl-CoA hydrolase-like protein 2, mitochondrial isoform X1 [Populus alba]